MKSLSQLACALFLFLCPFAHSSAATLKGYWEFASGPTASGYAGVASGGGASPFLVVEGSTPTFSASLSDSATTLNGVITTVTGAANRLRLTHGITPNGGSTSYVNKYTLMFDVFSPVGSRSSWRCFFQTNVSNTNDGEYFIRNSNDTLGTQALVYSTNPIDETRWKRVVISVNLGTAINTYVNGVLWKSHTSDVALNGHNSLDPSLLVFGDNDGENASLNVGAVAIWDDALTAAEAAALGNPGVALATGAPANRAPVITQAAGTTLNAIKNGPAVSTTLNATDPDGNALTWTVQTPPVNGTATATSSNTYCPISYTPAAGFSGSDSFVVRVSDGTLTASATVYVVTTESSGDPLLVGLWEFSDPTNRSKATVGFDLTPVGSGFGSIGGIDGSDGAMQVAVGSSYKVTHGITPNGGTTANLANRYTLMWDVRVPTASASIFKTLLQTNTANTDDGDLFINATNFVGTSGGLGGYSSSALTPNTWARVVLTVDNGVAKNVYLNGTKVLTGSVGTLDDTRYGLTPQILAFADENGEDGAIDVSNLATWNGVLSDSQIAILGSAGAPVTAVLPPKPTPLGLWQFNEPTKLDGAIIGNKLTRNGTSFTSVPGPVAGDGAVEIGVGSNYRVVHGLPASLGGSKVNEYTVLWDIKYPAAGTFKSLYQTNLANSDDGELLINTTGNIGQSALGGFSSLATSAGTWMRVVIVVKNGTQRSVYVNGSLWLTGNAGSIDDTYGLDPAAFLAFADGSGKDGVIDVSNLAVWGRALSASEVIVLGNTSTSVADGQLPLAPNNPPSIDEGDTYTINSTINGAASNVSLHATDANSADLLDWTLGSVPAHGSVSLTGSNRSATVNYIPAANFSGVDSFSILVSDGWASDEITFSVSISDPSAAPTLTIVSPFGTATPAVGTYTRPRGTTLANSVADEGNATTRRHCIGWSMIGDGPYSGTTNAMNMTLTRNSTLTWLWQTEFYVATSTSGSGTINLPSGWLPANNPVQITATPAAGQYFVGWTGDTTDCTIGGKSIVLPLSRPYANIQANFAPVQNFSVIAFPDTQNYTAITSPSDIFTRQTQWILDNKTTLNIKFLTHLGDIVDSAGSSSQWTRATAAMDLLNNKLPYGVCPGNHDLANNDTHYLTNFGPTHSRWIDPATGQNYSWYQGTSPRGYSNYEVLNLNGRDYLFLHIDCDCPDSDMAWAATVLSQHPRTVTMLTTHDYMAETGAYSSSGSGTGQRGRVNYPSPYISVSPDRNTVTDIWNTLVKPFNQVYMVICGHNFAQYNVQSINASGKIVHEVLADYQTLPHGGDGFLRIMEFRPALNQIYNTTYSPYLGRYMSNTSSPQANITSDNTGMLDLTDKNGGEFLLTTDFDTRFNQVLTINSTQPTVTPAVGTMSYEYGTPVVATAADRVNGQTRFRATGWSLTGALNTTGTGKTASFNMNGDQTLTWNWATEYYLDTQTTGRGIISVNSGWQAAGSTVSILAQPDAGFTFIGWSGDTAGCTVTGNSISVPMSRGRGPVTAEFSSTLPAYNVLVASPYDSVSPAPATYSFEQGTLATFTAQDLVEGATRHVCTGWVATGAVNQSGSGREASFAITGNTTLTWQWKNQYLLDTATVGFGTVTPAQWVDAGTSASVTATPSIGSGFGVWSGDTALGSAADNVFTIPQMTRPVQTLTANFVTGFHQLTVVSPQGNTIPVSGSSSLAHGTVVQFSADNVENGRARYVPAKWVLQTNGVTTEGTTTSGSFTLTADATLSWTWNSEVLLEISAGNEGTVLPMNAAGWRKLGEYVTLRAVAKPDFTFANWLGDAPNHPASPSISLRMANNETVSADFAPIKAPGGTPQWWLKRHAAPAATLAIAEQTDSDSDGQTAAQEFVAGMDDLDSQKTFRLVNLRPISGANPQVAISWPGVAGRIYSIWSPASLAAGASTTLLRDNLLADPASNLTTVQIPVLASGGNSQFFRVQIALAPGSELDPDPLATSFEPLAGSLSRIMQFIPSGSFTMGDDTLGEDSAKPTHSVYTAALFMDRFEVTYGDWQTVATWASTHGYDLPITLLFQPPLNHPAPGVSWYDAVKWCNARSEMEGRIPAYYTDATGSTVYRTGALDLTSDSVNWSGNGYRLPTEAEWEKACRGGLTGKLYSWGDEAPFNRANHWQYEVAHGHDQQPYPISTPVGYFNGSQEGGGPDVANGYGLYDMTGNAWEWNWDRFGSYSKASDYDPKGPDVGDQRLTRGGSWWNNVADLANAHRYPFPPVGETVYGQISFRCVRAAGPNEQ